MPTGKRIDRTRKNRPAPSDRYILALKDEADAQASGLRQRWEDIRAVRNRTHAIPIPEQYAKTCQPVRTHWVGDILRRVTAHLTLNTPTVSVPPPGPGDTAQRQSTLREKWSNAVLQELDQQGQPMRPFRTSMDHAASYGMGCLKVLFVSDAWPDYPTAQQNYQRDLLDLSDDERTGLERSQEQYKQGRLPVWLGAVDPRTWWGFYSQRRLRECLEVSERTVAQVTGDYNVTWNPQTDQLQLGRLSEPYVENQGPGTNNRRVIWIEHWDDTWVTYMADNVIVEQWRHGYGKPPYFPFYGLSNAMGEPGQQMESVVEHILDLVRFYDRLLTMWSNWAHVGAYPMGFIKATADAAPLAAVEGTAEEQMGPEFEFRPGMFLAMPPGHEPGWLQAPPVGRDLVAVSDVVRNFIEEVIPNVLRGIGDSDQAGYAINQLITAAKLVFDPITDNGALAYQSAVQFIWWLIEHKVQEKVYVWGDSPGGMAEGRKWLGLGPSDIRNYYACTVSIAPLLPSNRIAEGQFGLQQAEAGAIPMRLHREEFLHIPNPEEIDDEVRVEQILNDPQSPLSQMIVQRALKRAGLADELEQQQQDMALQAIPLPVGLEQRMMADQAAAQAGAAAPGVPGVGNLAPTPGLGMPLLPPEPAPPGMPMGAAGVPGAGLPSGMPGGRAAGMGTQPSTQGLPGGLPGG